MTVSSKSRQITASVVKYACLLIFLLFILLPFYWMLVTSVRPFRELYARNLQFFPKTIIWQHYAELFFNTDFFIWFKNSWLVASVTTIISLCIGSLGAYSLVRFDYPGKETLARFILITYLIPRTILFIPLYSVIRDLGLFDTHLGLVFAYTTFALPFCTWMLMGYFKSIPPDMELAAMVDGCSRLQSFFRILLPVSLPGLIASGVFAFNLANNEYLYALTYINNEKLMTLPRGLSTMIMGDVYLWGEMMAAALTSSIPLVLFYMFVQRYLVFGMTAGSLKG